MDLEKIEQELEDDLHIRNSGYLSRSHFEDHRNHVIGGLILFGDLFAMALGYALKEAGLNDSMKIMRYWNNMCEQHAILLKASKAKEEVLNMK